MSKATINQRWHWPGQLERRRVIEMFHDAMDASNTPYHERDTGVVDCTSGETVDALLNAGWIPPAR